MDKEAFDKLRQHWYARLRATGFKDNECFRGALKDFQSKTRVKWDVSSTLGRTVSWAYFDCAKEFLRTHKHWATKRDKKMWQMHADAISISNIAKKLKTTSRVLNTRFSKYKAIFHTRWGKDKVKVVIRDKVKDDENFIYHSYLRNHFYSNDNKTTLPKDV